MQEGYAGIIVLFVAALVVSLGVVWIGRRFGPRRLAPRKAEPCRVGSTRTRFYRFVALSVLFQVGVVLLYPWALLFLDVDERSSLFVDGLIFGLILCVGYAYAWKKGALDWD